MRARLQPPTWIQSNIGHIVGHLWKHKTDLTGQRFGRLLVLREAPRLGQRGSREYWRRRWVCRCDCGTEWITTMDNLHAGDTASCGCWKREDLGNRRRTHGRTYSTEYHVWASMKQRCTNPHAEHYEDYGGRGITICAEWLDSFEKFLADMGPRPSPYFTLDRRDNDGPYTKDNCRWATRNEQANNRRERRAGMMLVTHDNRTQTLAAWAREKGLNKHTLYCRLHRGWSTHRAFTS
jgi:hypothetical protein